VNKKLAIIAILFFCAALFTLVACNSLRRSKDVIEKQLQKITPLGTQYNVAVKLLEQHFSEIQQNTNTGFLKQEGPTQEVIGVKSIEVPLGSYRNFPFGSTWVRAYWGFDENGRLLEIWVWKDEDSI
jgi:hypothetical protein